MLIDGALCHLDETLIDRLAAAPVAADKEFHSAPFQTSLPGVAFPA
jgi:hypothetical protein